MMVNVKSNKCWKSDQRDDDIKWAVAGPENVRYFHPPFFKNVRCKINSLHALPFRILTHSMDKTSFFVPGNVFNLRRNGKLSDGWNVFQILYQVGIVSVEITYVYIYLLQSIFKWLTLSCLLFSFVSHHLQDVSCIPWKFWKDFILQSWLPYLVVYILFGQIVTLINPKVKIYLIIYFLFCCKQCMK